MKNEIPVQSFGSAGVMNRPQVWKAVGLALLACGLQLYGQQKAAIVTFDDPAAGTGQYQGTFATTISPGGVIAGYYLDVNNVYHGFVRARGGSFANFDAPGAGNSPNAYPIQGTQAFSINPALVVVGYYTDTNSITHCFLRAPNGTFASIDPPGSLGSTDTFPIVINPAGTITGNYGDTSGFHGFLRAPSGTFTPFDPPNSASSSQTYPTAINPAGAITGIYEDASFVFHGFLRVPNGTIISFDPAGSTYTQPYGINRAGVITGYYFDPFGVHGFLRAPNGTFTTFDFPGSNQGTFVYAINSVGTVTGNYFASNQYHGFLRTRNGTFTSFDPPGSTNTTAPTAINPAGEITGYYPDANFINHGFLRIAQEE
jgi:uncharacterized membrane protein